jgi:hypothetical protein
MLFDDLLLYGGCDAFGVLGRSTAKLLQARIPIFFETRLPIIECPLADPGFPTGFGYISGCFPGLEE